MSDSSYRLIDSSFLIYYKPVNVQEIDSIRQSIYKIDNHEDNFNFLMAQNNIDSSFDNLNRAFVIMMKEIDAKLNYLISLIRDKTELDKFLQYKKTISCKVSAGEIHFMGDEKLRSGDIVSLSFFLPISSHNEIKAIGQIYEIAPTDNSMCAKAKFLEINKQNQELIIYYGLVLDRERLKSKQLEL